MLPSSEKALRLFLKKDMLAMVMRTGVMSRAQSLSSHLGMGSSSQDLTGDDLKSTPISISEQPATLFGLIINTKKTVTLCQPPPG